MYQRSIRTRPGLEHSGLLSYGADFRDIFLRAAPYVDRILRGAKPEELPVQLPTKFEMVVNLKTAKALGLTVPQSILLRAAANMIEARCKFVNPSGMTTRPPPGSRPRAMISVSISASL